MSTMYGSSTSKYDDPLAILFGNIVVYRTFEITVFNVASSVFFQPHYFIIANVVRYKGLLNVMTTLLGMPR